MVARRLVEQTNGWIKEYHAGPEDGIEEIERQEYK
jgi:hypothetical protein